ncbi:MAG: DUF4358 domain-containing protein [Lachnospiraceae bacterium]|nr:DUF4358 domain-containing protein [Lachnospiraceae bacterium]
MKKNKILTVCSLLAVSVVLLTACGKKNNGNTGENTESTTPQTSSQEGNNTGNTLAESTEPAQESSLMYLRDAVAEALGEDYWPDSVMEPEYVQDLYGLKPDMYEDIFVETPMIGTNVDTLIIVQAKKDRVEDVEKALNTYREGEINNTMQYPMNIGKVQASRIETIDNYVLFIQLGGSSVDAEEEGEEKVMELSREQNEKALEAIRQALEENSAGSGRTR